MDTTFFASQTESSRIKANIVANYFPKYCKILFKAHKGNIRYLDLFAGPGVYDDGKESTPMLIGEACAKDPILKSRVLMLFNDNECCNKLRTNFETKFPTGTFANTPRFADRTVGEDSAIENYLNKIFEKGTNTPTLLFFDPFGYKGINSRVLANFMANFGNEIFLFFNIKRIHAAIENDKFDSMMNELFPTTIHKIRNDRKYTLNVQNRLNLIIENLAEEFKSIIPGIYHCAFKFQEEDSLATSHYIIHFTKHPRGFDLVKQVYTEFDNVGATLDKNGDYTFDAKYLSSETMFDFGDMNTACLSQILSNDFKSQTISAYDLFEQHHCKTKYSRKHYCNALRQMAKDGAIMVEYTDAIKHNVEVLINKNCILKFK